MLLYQDLFALYINVGLFYGVVIIQHIKALHLDDCLKANKATSACMGSTYWKMVYSCRFFIYITFSGFEKRDVVFIDP